MLSQTTLSNHMTSLSKYFQNITTLLQQFNVQCLNSNIQCPNSKLQFLISWQLNFLTILPLLELDSEAAPSCPSFTLISSLSVSPDTPFSLPWLPLRIRILASGLSFKSLFFTILAIIRSSRWTKYMCINIKHWYKNSLINKRHSCYGLHLVQILKALCDTDEWSTIAVDDEI